MSIRPGETEAGVPEFDGWELNLRPPGPSELAGARWEEKSKFVFCAEAHRHVSSHTHAQKCVNTHVHSECEKFQDGDGRWLNQDELTSNRPLHESGAHKLAPSPLGSAFSRLSLVCPVYSSRHKLSPGRMQPGESDVDVCTLLLSS